MLPAPSGPSPQDLALLLQDLALPPQDCSASSGHSLQSVHDQVVALTTYYLFFPLKI